jgi:DNA-binding CsgD family transcriptional regulator
VVRTYIWREGHQELVDDALGRARAGAPRPILVTGDPGTGKTSLLNEVAQAAERTGFRVVAISADAVDSGAPYAAFLPALAATSTGDDAPALHELARSLRHELDRGPHGDASNHRAVIHDLVRRLFSGWAFRGPVALVVDDLHTADPDTVACVLFLIRRLPQERVLIMATSRTESTDLDPVLAATLTRFEHEKLLTTVDLGSFDDSELAELVAATVGDRPDDALVAMLRDRTGGNPFFVVELLDALSSANALIHSDHVVRLEPGIQLTLPRTVTTAVLHRVFRLGPAARAVASAASALGHVDLDRLDLLASLAGVDGPTADEAFDTLVLGRILVGTDDGYRFAHPLVLDALYQDLGPAARRRLHAQIADAFLQDLAGGGAIEVVDVAGHVRRGAQGTDAAAALLVAEAGDAVISAAPAAAVGWYRDALRLLPKQDAAVPAVQVKLGRALNLTARYVEAAKLATAAAAQLPPGAERAEALALAATALSARGRLDDAALLLDDALADRSMQAARLLVSRATLFLWQERPDDARRCIDRARGVGLGGDLLLADAVEVHLAHAAGRHREAQALAERLQKEADSLPLEQRAPLLLLMSAAAADDGDPRDVLRYAEDLEATAAMPDWCKAFTSFAHYRLGNLVDAYRIAESTCTDADRPRSEPAAVLAAAVRASVLAEHGDAAGAAELVRLVDGSVEYAHLVDAAAALASMLNGDLDPALTRLSAACERERQRGRANRLSRLLALEAEVSWRAGDEDAARAANAELQMLPGDDDGVANALHRLMTRALVTGDADSAAEAIAHAGKFDLALDRARSVGQLGALRGDSALLLEAYEELDRLGAVMRQREVGHHLRRLGLRVPRRQRRAGQLTSVELEVANLVARGLTNRQVAEAAGLSLKTVEVYLSRIYAKTGYHTRVELAVALTSGAATS